MLCFGFSYAHPYRAICLTLSFQTRNRAVSITTFDTTTSNIYPNHILHLIIQNKKGLPVDEKFYLQITLILRLDVLQKYVISILNLYRSFYDMIYTALVDTFVLGVSLKVFMAIIHTFQYTSPIIISLCSLICMSDRSGWWIVFPM